MKILDPKGNELRPVLLQVLTEDENGPLTLKVRADGNEVVDLGNASVTERQFYVAYMPKQLRIGSKAWGEMLAEIDELKETRDFVRAVRAELDQAVATSSRAIAALEADNAKKTEALRDRIAARQMREEFVDKPRHESERAARIKGDMKP